MSDLECIVEGFQAMGAKAVALADPRLPVFLGSLDLPAVVLTPIAATTSGVIPGHPHEIETVDNPDYGPEEGKEPWEKSAKLWYRFDAVTTFQVDVYGKPGTDTVFPLAWKLIGWLGGVGREELRERKCRIASFTAPQRRVELGVETEYPALEHCGFEFALVTPQAASVTVPTVEEVHGRGEYEGAVVPERTFVVKTTK